MMSRCHSFTMYPIMHLSILILGRILIVEAAIQVQADKTKYSKGQTATIACTNTETNGVLFQKDTTILIRCLGETGVCFKVEPNEYTWSSHYQESPSRFVLKFEVDDDTKGMYYCQDSVNSSQKDEIYVTYINGSPNLAGSIVGCLLQVLLCSSLSTVVAYI